MRLAADENFDGRIVRGLLRISPGLDLVRVQDSPASEADDDAVLEWAAQEARVVLTHDVGTMTAAAWARVRRGLAMPGLIEVSAAAPIGRAVEDLQIIVTTSRPGEHENQVLFVPL